MPEASGIPITPKPINRSSPPDGISAADSSFAAKVLRDVMVTAPCSPCTGHSFLYVPSGKGDSLGPGDNLFHHLGDRKSTRLNSSHQIISYAVFCLKKKNTHPLMLRHHT